MADDHASIENLGLSAEQRKAVGFLAEFSKRMVLFAFSEQRTPASAATLIQEIDRFTDEMLSGCLQSGARLPCKKGCSWCCYLRVKVTPLEVMGIVDDLHSRLKPGKLAALWERLAWTDGIIRGMDGLQRIGAKIACPLLVDGTCLAYQSRPIACRVHHSLDASDCQALLEKGGDSVATRRDIFGLSMGIFAGLTVGLRAAGLQTRLLELTAGLRISMEHPASSLSERWLAGEPAFAEAALPNAEQIESVHRALLEELGEALHEN